MPSFKSLLGQDNLFADWAEQCDQWNLETPQEYMWLSLAVGMGHLVGYRTWMPTSTPHRFYPTLSGILLSPSGEGRRSTGSSIAMDIVRRAGGNILDGTTTPEGLVDMLKRAEGPDNGGARLLWYIGEMSDTFSRKQSQAHLISKATALLNRSDDYKDVSRGGMKDAMGQPKDPVCVVQPCLTFLGTSAAEWFLTEMPESAKSGGFMSRLVGVYLEQRDRIHIDLTPIEGDDSQIRVKWGKRLYEHTQSVAGPFKVSPAANRHYQAWYQQCELATRGLPEGPERTIRVRRPENTLKVAMLLAIAQRDMLARMTIDERLLDQADAIMSHFEPTMGKFYNFTTSHESIGGQLARAIERTLVKGPHGHSQLSRLVNYYTVKAGGVKFLKSILQAMCEQGKIGYKPKSGISMDPFTSDHAWPPQRWYWKGEESEGVVHVESVGSGNNQTQIEEVRPPVGLA